jgi:hypothetical protein
MFSTRKRMTIFVAVVITVVAGGVTGGVVLGASQTGAPHRPRPISPSLRRHFSVLRSARAAAASQGIELPAGVAQEVTEAGGMSAEYKLEPAQARHLTLPNGSDAWVIPGAAGACLFVQGSAEPESGGACGSVASANAGTIMIVKTNQSTGAKVVFGLVPDGGEAVTLTDSDGSTTQVPVNDNVYETSVSPGSQSITVRDAQGNPTVTRLPGE